MGVGPLLPVQGTIGFLEKALIPFVKKEMKQSKHLDALQPSFTVDGGIVLPLCGVGEDDGLKVEAELTCDEDHVDTVKVRGYSGYRLYPFCSA